MDTPHTSFPLPPENISLASAYDRGVVSRELRNHPPPPVLFPPILLSQPTSLDTQSLEEPALCKSIVYVPISVEPQDAGGPIRRKAPMQTAPEKVTQPSTCSPSDYCEKIVSSVWEEAHDAAQEREMSRCERRKSRNGAADQQGIVQALVQDSALCMAELAQSFQVYARQWKTMLHCKVVESCSRVCCANLVWCLVLGAWLEQKTAGHVGVVETVVASAVCGALFDVLGGHALLIVGASSSSLVFVLAISTSGERLGLEIVPWMGWIGLWSSLVLLLLAISRASRLTTHMTFFSWDVLRVFVGLTFLWGALEQIVHLFNSSVPLDSALLSLWLATSAFVLASYLESARHWRAFHPQTCNAIADYGPVLVLLLFTAVPHLPKLSQPQISQSFPG